MAESNTSTRGEGIEEWQRIPATGTVPPPRSAAASCIVGDELYVFGGAGEGIALLDDFWKYSFQDAAWERVHVLSDIKPDARSNAGFCVCNDSKTIYMFGGWFTGRKLNDFWKFDIRSNHWTCIHAASTSDTSPAAQGVNGHMPSKRYGHVSAIHNGKLILFGGSDDDYLNDLHIFDLETDTWTEVKARQGVWPSPRSEAAWTKDSRCLYIHGGDDSRSAASKSDFFALDLETYKWKEIMPVGTAAPPRFGHNICLHENQIYLHGGSPSTNSPFSYPSDMFIYHIDDNLWTQKNCSGNDAPHGRAAAAFHVHENSMYLFGGYHGSTESTELNDFYRYHLDPINVPPAALANDMQSLIGNPEFADVHFVVEGNEIHAHKNILGTRSEYFQTMFSSGMREGTSKAPIEISEVSHATFLKVLEFLYADKVECKSLEESKDLLAASNMFRLDRLKALCEDWIRPRLSKETVISVLMFSHLHQATGLKQCAMDYLMQNWKDPVVKEHRSELQADPALMLEVLNQKD